MLFQSETDNNRESSFHVDSKQAQATGAPVTSPIVDWLWRWSRFDMSFLQSCSRFSGGCEICICQSLNVQAVMHGQIVQHQRCLLPRCATARLARIVRAPDMTSPVVECLQHQDTRNGDRYRPSRRMWSQFNIFTNTRTERVGFSIGLALVLSE